MRASVGRSGRALDANTDGNVRRSKLPIEQGQRSVTLLINPKNQNEPFYAQAYVVNTITRRLPNKSMNEHPEFAHLQLADPKYGSPSEIEALFGIGIWVKILAEGVLKSHNHTAAAQNTSLGWVVYQMSTDDPQNLNRCILHAKQQIKTVYRNCWNCSPNFGKLKLSQKLNF